MPGGAAPPSGSSSGAMPHGAGRQGAGREAHLRQVLVGTWGAGASSGLRVGVFSHLHFTNHHVVTGSG